MRRITVDALDLARELDVTYEELQQLAERLEGDRVITARDIELFLIINEPTRDDVRKVQVESSC